MTETIPRRFLTALAALFLASSMTVALATPAWAITCPTGQVVWVDSWASSDGTYQRIITSGPDSQFWYGDDVGYHSFRTGVQSVSWANTATNASSHSTSQFCVPAGIS